MELLLVLRVLLRRWVLVVVPVAVAAAFVAFQLLTPDDAAGAGYTTMVHYTAAQVLEAIPERDGDYQDVWLASELTVNAFTDWIRSSSFPSEVAAVLRETGLDIDPAALAFAADNERSTGRIYINWHDAGELEAITEAALRVMQTRSDDYFPQLGDTPARVTLLDQPRISAAAQPLTNRLTQVLPLAVALLAGIALAFIVEYLDPMLRRHDQLELPLLGVIPRE